MNKSFVVIEADLETKSFDKQLEEIEYRLKELDFELSHAKELKLDKRTIKEYEKEVEKLNNQYVNLKHQQDKLNQHDFSQIGKGIENITKKVGKWALAVFGVRSAYMFVRNAINTISQDDEQLANDIDNMKRALAYTIEPVVRTIVNLAKTLMGYIAYIVKAWTGKDIFARANKGLKNANKQAKELQKTSAGFDKFNKLSSNKSNGSYSTSSSTELKIPKDDEVPKWVQAIKDFGNLVIKNWPLVLTLLGITGLVLFGVKFLKNAKKAKDVVKGLSADFTGFFDSVGKGIEAIAILGGLALVIDSISKLIKEFGKSGLELKDVIGLLASIAGTLVIIITALTIAANALQSPLAMGGLILLTASIVSILLVLKATLPTILDAISNFIIKIAPTFIKILETVGDIIERIAKVLGDIFIGILETIGELIKTVSNTILDFVNKIGPAINKFVTNIMKAVKSLVNFVVQSIEYMVNLVVIDGINAIIKGINKIGKYIGVDIKLIPDFKMRKFNPSIPKLAKGGIVNMPGKGINYGYANIGERGAEWVQPLTDEEALNRVGSAIGRHVNVNADITLELESRVLARVMQQINNDNKFARNGG